MAKFCHDDVQDGALNIIKTNATTLLVCSSLPSDRASALAAALADVAVSSTDFTIAAGDVSGRKVTVAAKSGVTIDTGGNGTHVALIDGTRLLYATTCTLKALVANDQVNIPAFDIESTDPA